jgi:hypothetical protein
MLKQSLPLANDPIGSWDKNLLLSLSILIGILATQCLSQGSKNLYPWRNLILLLFPFSPLFPRIERLKLRNVFYLKMPSILFDSPIYTINFLGVITFSPHELPKNARCPHELPTRPK